MSSMLSRFRKPGGFLQLLQLMETCDPIKQKNLLHLVGNEDPGWAHLVKIKTLSLEKVLSWPPEILMEITPHLPDPVLAAAYQVAQSLSPKGSPQLQEKWINSLPSIKAKEIKTICEDSKITEGEKLSASIKIVQVVRELEAKGKIRLGAFDPSLELDKRIAA